MSELGRARLVRHGFVVDCGVEIRTGSNRIELFGQISDSDLLVFRLLVTKFDFECRLAGGKSFDINNAQDSNRVGNLGTSNRKQIGPSCSDKSRTGCIVSIHFRSGGGVENAISLSAICPKDAVRLLPARSLQPAGMMACSVPQVVKASL